MQGFKVEDTRTLAVVGHSRSGKTSLIESILFKSGKATRLGSVDAGTSLADYNQEEKDRKVTIYSKPLNCAYKGKNLFVIDTPGYGDFFGEVVSSLSVADSCVVVVNGVSGIEVGTQRVWRKMEEKKSPRILFINKLNKENADFHKIVDSLRSSFGNNCVPLQVPVGKEKDFKGVANVLDSSGEVPSECSEEVEKYKSALMESAAETDDALLEKYLETGTLSEEEMMVALKKGIAEGKIVPILCGAATSEIGTVELLDAIANFMPSPVDVGGIKVEGETKCKPDPNGPLGAFVFKAITDSYVGQVTFLRVYSGTIKSDSSIYNVTKDAKEKIGQLAVFLGKQQQGVTDAGPGDIVAVTKLKNTDVNDSFSDQSKKIIFKPISFPKPSISFAVKPRAKGDEEKIGTGLQRLSHEDQTFEVSRDKDTKELVISGMGDLHLDIMLEKLKAKFGVEVDKSAPKIAYKETIKGNGAAKYRHKKQSGGAGQFGEVWLRVEPIERGKGFEFVDEVVGGSIPAQFVASCEKGIKGSMGSGPMAGYPVVDVRAIVYDGKTHPVDSKDIAFQIAARKAFREACLGAKPVLLEPIVNVEIYVSSDFMGDITGDLSSKRGRVQGMDQVGDTQVVRAQVPIAEMSRYSTDLKSMTGGRGSFSMEFSHYEEVPANLAQDITEKSGKKHEEED